ncbi:MAG: hypothetical protein ACYTAO_16470, partial [Planctomycetota bacterium]
MKRSTVITSIVKGMLAVCLLAGMAEGRENSPSAQAKEIFDMAGVQGGIVVHLGCGDGRLTAALRPND